MRNFTFLALLWIILLLAGCGAAASPSVPGAAGISAVDDSGRTVTLSSIPTRIVALGNGESDIVAALGGHLVGRPDTSYTPANSVIQAAEPIGNTHEVNLEKIALLRPDIVFGHYPMNEKDIPTLEGIGTKVFLTGANSISDIERQIELIGELLKQEVKAGELIASIEEAAAAYRDALPQNHGQKRALLVYGAPGTFMAALPNSLAGNILETVGGINIASDYPSLQSYPQYAQINAERIVEANPHAIFIMTHGKPEEVKDSFLREMKTNSSWSSLEAVRENRVTVLPADLFGTNPGTRIIEAMAIMSEELSKDPQ